MTNLYSIAVYIFEYCYSLSWLWVNAKRREVLFYSGIRAFCCQ